MTDHVMNRDELLADLNYHRVMNNKPALETFEGTDDELRAELERESHGDR